MLLVPHTLNVSLPLFSFASFSRFSMAACVISGVSVSNALDKRSREKRPLPVTISDSI
jgi:hypothetical protein